jgi:CBS domain containing-hemolysin-like protein
VEQSLTRGGVLHNAFPNLEVVTASGRESPPVPRSRRLVDLFEDLRHQSRRLAVVIDEAGQPLGMVTL